MSSFWRKDLIDPALDEQTLGAIREQKTWISHEPSNPRPYHNLAQLYRIQARADEALALELHAVTLDTDFGPAHVALAEMYAVRGDYSAAWRHARAAEAAGDGKAVAMLARQGVGE
ncbi:MAG: tetratricopeptide repeat protein [Bryobacteraceae bacterium]